MKTYVYFYLAEMFMGSKSIALMDGIVRRESLVDSYEDFTELKKDAIAYYNKDSSKKADSAILKSLSLLNP